MKRLLSTTLMTFTIAGTAMAASRGNDNTTGAEAADKPAQAETSVIENAATEDAASRGDDMITGAEATKSDLIKSDEVPGTAKDADDAQRGAANDTGSEIEAEKSDS